MVTKDLITLFAETGHLVRVAPNTLLLDDPDTFRQIMGARSRYIRSPDWYAVARFDPDRDTLFNLVDDNLHTQMRKKMAPGVSSCAHFYPQETAEHTGSKTVCSDAKYKILTSILTQYFGKENDSLEAGVDNRVAAFIKLVEDKYISTGTQYRPMDIASRSQYFTIDVITELAFGKTFNCIEQDADVRGYVPSIEGNTPRVPLINMFPKAAKYLYKRPLRWIFFPEDKPVGLGPIIG